MHFGTKSYLKSNRNHTVKYLKRKAVATVHIACIRDSGLGMISNSNGGCASCGGVFTLLCCFLIRMLKDY
jgi:hypothetical protein